MGLLSIFQRNSGATATPRDAASIEVERRRARRRLLGSIVLVLAGVVGLPMLFDRAPRPLPVDIPIEIPRKDEVAPLVDKPGKPAASARKVDEAPAEPTAVTPSAPAAAASGTVESREAKAIDKPADKPTEKPPEPRADKATEGKAAAKSNDKPAEKPADKAAEATANAKKAAAEASRAQAALEGRPSAAATKPDAPNKPSESGVRFVVQVGAFSEADSAREARARVEKLGLKTYTQVVETSAGKRIRVRLGPYDDRSEADKVAAKIKQAGIASAVLTL